VCEPQPLVTLESVRLRGRGSTNSIRLERLRLRSIRCRRLRLVTMVDIGISKQLPERGVGRAPMIEEWQPPAKQIKKQSK
jgi:hypothetical protein